MSTENKSLKFIHLANTAAASEGSYDKGAIIFEPKSGRIAVKGNSGLEYYGGGRIADATFDENKILTLSFNDGSKAITLDFSDTASASGVNKILGKLRFDVDALKTTVGDDNNGLVKKVNDNKTAIDAINNPTTGILAEAKKYTDDKVGGIAEGTTVKDYVDTAKADAIEAANSYADGLAKNYDAAGAAAQALVDAKAYTDGKVSEINTTTDNLRKDLGEKTAAAGTDTAFARIKALEGTVGDASNGLVKKVDDLSKLHADKDDKTGKKTVAEEVTAGVNAKVGEIAEGTTVKKYVDDGDKAVKDHVDAEVLKINGTTADLRTDVNALKTTVGDSSNGLVKDVADNTGKLNTLIGTDTDKSVRTIANEELAAQLIPEGAKESLNTLQEIAAWIQNHPDDASAMNTAIDALKKAVGEPAKGEVAATGLYKDIADNKSAINVNAGAIDALEALHAPGKNVAAEVSEGIAGIIEHSETNDKVNPKTADVVVTVTTKAGSVSGVAVDAGVLAGKVSKNAADIAAETERATGVEGDLRTAINAVSGDLGTRGEGKGTAFDRIATLEKNQADGALMWFDWKD